MMRDDAVFGVIFYEKDHGGMWVNRPDISGGHLVSVCADEGGPSDTQRRLYADLCGRLEALVARCREYVAEHGEHDAAELTLYAIHLDDDTDTQNGRFTVELTDDDAEEIHVLVWSGDEIVDYGVDD